MEGVVVLVRRFYRVDRISTRDGPHSLRTSFKLKCYRFTLLPLGWDARHAWAYVHSNAVKPLSYALYTYVLGTRPGVIFAKSTIRQYCCRPLSPPISWLYLVPEATSSSRRKKSPEAARYRDLIHKGPPLFNLSSCLLLSCALLSEFMGEGGNYIPF